MTRRYPILPLTPRLFTLSLLLLMLVATGCKGSKVLSIDYGASTGKRGKAVGGTSVLAGIFRERGFQVYKWTKLWPKLRKHDVLVWIPDRFNPPTKSERKAIEKWLSSGSGRTLLYVGRDYDPVSDYWERVQTGLPAAKAWTIQRRLARSKSDHDLARSEIAGTIDFDWFRFEQAPGRRLATELRAKADWLDGIDPDKTEIQLGHRMLSPSNFVSRLVTGAKFESLLRSGKDVIIGQYRKTSWRNSKILLVNNGSFLLNLPLVNQEHRKLADKIVVRCGIGESVVFLESGKYETDVRSKDRKSGMNGLEMFTTWPINLVLMHLFALGIVFCFARFPVFGRPRQAETKTISDFGKHITAVAELMAKTGDNAYLQARLSVYQNQVRGEANSPSPKPPDSS